jgi:hypothetical protein
MRTIEHITRARVRELRWRSEAVGADRPLSQLRTLGLHSGDAADEKAVQECEDARIVCDNTASTCLQVGYKISRIMVSEGYGGVSMLSIEKIMESKS